MKLDRKYKGSSAWISETKQSGGWPFAFQGSAFGLLKGVTDLTLDNDKRVRDRLLIEALEQLDDDQVNQQDFYVTTHCNNGSFPFYTEDLLVESPPNRSEYFQIVFQCRIRPDSYTVHKIPVRTGSAWRLVDPSAVRPDGILLKSRATKAPLQQ